jgi:hypothetical protein
MIIIQYLTIRQRTLIALVAVAVIFLVFLSTGIDGRNFHWADRDLTRAAGLWWNFQVAGAEYTYTGRTPGGAYYYVLWALLQISNDAQVIYIAWMAALMVIVVYVADWIGKLFSWRVAMLFTIGLLGNYAILNNIGMLWNPTIGFPFMLLSLLFIWRMVATRNGMLIVPAFAFSGIAIQCHLSFIYVLLIALLSSFVTRLERRWTGYAMAIVALLVIFSPYLTYEIQHDFPIYKEAANNKVVESVSIIATPINLSAVSEEGKTLFKRFIVSAESLKYMITVPFGVIFDTTGELPKGAMAQLAKLAKGIVFSGGILFASIVFTFWFAFTRVIHRRISPLTDRERISGLLILSIILTTILMSWQTVGIYPRYLLFIIPCGSLLGAVALDLMWSRSAGNHFYRKRIPVLMLVAWWSIGLGYNIYSMIERWRSTDGAMSSLSMRDSLRKSISQFVDAQNFTPSGIAVLHEGKRQSGERAANRIGEVHSFFFGELAKRHFAKDGEVACVGVIANATSDIETGKSLFYGLVEERSGLGENIHWGKAQRIGQHIILSYSLPQGNCLDTARNYWIYSDIHKKAFELSTRLGTDPVEIDGPENTRRFVFKLDQIGQFRLVLDIVGEGTGFRTILRSYGLQNQYFRDTGLVKPALEFRLADDPGQYRIEMALEAPVGTVTPGLETPIRSALAPYPMQHLREIKFIVDRVIGVDGAPVSGRFVKILVRSQ